MSAGLLPYPRMKEMRQYTEARMRRSSASSGLATPEGKDEVCGERPPELSPDPAIMGLGGVREGSRGRAAEGLTVVRS